MVVRVEEGDVLGEEELWLQEYGRPVGNVWRLFDPLSADINDIRHGIVLIH